MARTNRLSKDKFDEIIKNNLIESGVLETDFIMKDKPKSGSGMRDRRFYYTESIFDNFVTEMRTVYPAHYAKFKGNGSSQNAGGVGGELNTGKTGYVNEPPKMACVASSSRFCYLALRNGVYGVNPLLFNREITGQDVEFEKECQISSVSKPQLDAFVAGEECDVFIEAKCHEIFDSHKPTFKRKYVNYFKKHRLFSDFTFPKAEEFTLTLELFGFVEDKTDTRFDCKQFVSHLLGIANYNKGKKKSKLVYLFFKPVVSDGVKAAQVEEVFNELKEEIKTVFTCSEITQFCQKNNIELMAVALNNDVMTKLNVGNNGNTEILWM